MREGQTKKGVFPCTSPTLPARGIPWFFLPSVPEFFARQNAPVCPGPGPGRWVRGRGLAGCLVSLIDGRLLGLPPAHPMILGAGLTPGLVRDGGSVAGDAEP